MNSTLLDLELCWLEFSSLARSYGLPFLSTNSRQHSVFVGSNSTPFSIMKALQANVENYFRDPMCYHHTTCSRTFCLKSRCA